MKNSQNLTRNPWHIPKLWEGDCYVLGGGPSLKTIPFEKLHNKRVVGCNDAYLLGEKVVDFVCYGDSFWMALHYKTVPMYKGLVITNAKTRTHDLSNTKWLRRSCASVETNQYTLGWFKNTGTMALELAAKLGAKRIIMLGFDMSLSSDGVANWYVNLRDKPNAKVYSVFMRGFVTFKKEMERVYPDVEIINANLSSALPIFPKQKWEDFL